MSKIFTYIPSAYKAGKAYIQLPMPQDPQSNEVYYFIFTRPAQAARIDEDLNIEVMDVNVPRIDYSDAGCPKLLLEAIQNEKAFAGAPLDVDGDEFVWESEMQSYGNTGATRYVKLFSSSTNNVSMGYDAVPNQILFLHQQASGTNVIIYSNCDTTLFRKFSIRKSNDIIEAKLDGVYIGTQSSVGTLPTLTQITYSDSGQEMDGKVRDNTVDDDVTTFDSQASTYSELDLVVKNYTIR